MHDVQQHGNGGIPVLPKLLTCKEAAEILGLKTQTVRMWVSAKKIPYIKIGSSVRFTLEQIEEFIENSQVRAVK